jgi:hypothetical protein
MHRQQTDLQTAVLENEVGLAHAEGWGNQAVLSSLEPWAV